MFTFVHNCIVIAIHLNCKFCILHWERSWFFYHFKCLQITLWRSIGFCFDIKIVLRLCSLSKTFTPLFPRTNLKWGNAFMFFIISKNWLKMPICKKENDEGLLNLKTISTSKSVFPSAAFPLMSVCLSKKYVLFL